MRVLTIGYEGVKIDEFIDVLLVQGVHTLVDVRDFPLSRKPGFSKNPLSQALADVNILYVHEKVLGTPKPIRDALKETGDWATYEKSYLSFLAPREVHLSRVLDFDSVCLMCFEADHLECHRSLVARRMYELHLVDEVKHLHPATKKVNPSLVLA